MDLAQGGQQAAGEQAVGAQDVGEQEEQLEPVVQPSGHRHRHPTSTFAVSELLLSEALLLGEQRRLRELPPRPGPPPLPLCFCQQLQVRVGSLVPESGAWNHCCVR